MTTKSTQHAEPFADDVVYIAAEGSLLLARADRMDLEDVIQGQETCTNCSAVEPAEGAGFVKCDPPELLVYLCRKCRVNPHD